MGALRACGRKIQRGTTRRCRGVVYRVFAADPDRIQPCRRIARILWTWLECRLRPGGPVAPGPFWRLCVGSRYQRASHTARAVGYRCPDERLPDWLRRRDCKYVCRCRALWQIDPRLVRNIQKSVFQSGSHRCHCGTGLFQLTRLPRSQTAHTLDATAMIFLVRSKSSKQRTVWRSLRALKNALFRWHISIETRSPMKQKAKTRWA